MTIKRFGCASVTVSISDDDGFQVVHNDGTVLVDIPTEQLRHGDWEAFWSGIEAVQTRVEERASETRTAQNDDARPAKPHGYDILITPLDGIVTDPSGNGAAKIRFRGTFEISGQRVERTVLAQGRVANEIREHVSVGQPVMLHIVFARRRTDTGEEGGEYLNVIRLSEARRKAA